MDFPVTGPELTSSVWDWNDLLELTSDDHLPFPLTTMKLWLGIPIQLRRPIRDPRMTCSNFIAGRVPCACPEIDAQVEKLEEEEAGAPGKKRARTGRVGSGTCRCQVPGCEVDISELKGYHRRHRICLRCANSSTVLIDGETKRYCQQCGKFHLLSDFDEGKRSCRRKLERHNIRRRRKLVGSQTAVNKESQGAIQSDGIACDGEAGKDGLSGLIAEEEPAFESEEALVSAHCSAPLLQDIRNDSVVTLIDTETDGGKDDSKFSNSTSYCDSKTAYSSMCPTGRISFKLYDWNPAEFPRRLRHQIFEWLANMPVELEGYIRPGCTILTVFISMPNNMWVKLSENPMTYMHDFVFRPGRMLYGRDGTSMVKIDAEVQVPRLHFVYPACFEAGKPMEFYLLPEGICPVIIVLHPHLFRVKMILLVVIINYTRYTSKTELDLFGPAFIEVENQSGLSNFIPVLIGDKEVCSEMKSIQQRFDASVFQERSIFSATGSLFEACETSTSQHRAYSEFLLDIAWLLREPTLENFKETMASSQILRFNRLLSFLIQNESTFILKKKILQSEDCGGDDRKYMNHARDILSNELQKGEIPVFRSEYIEQERNQVSQSSFDNDELSIVPNISQVLEERTSKLQTIMAAPTPSETVPLLNKEIIMNVNLSKGYSRKSCGFATMRLSSRPAVLIIAATAICLGMCAVIFHPNRVGEFAVTIRRCLFDRGVRKHPPVLRWVSEDLTLLPESQWAVWVVRGGSPPLSPASALCGKVITSWLRFLFWWTVFFFPQ
ncbi:hypothetical protein CXB51_025645 [Gossypium anomalum]|uniref:SBP-type domain-containing protein n=1 Tax=Gossypium anomalum TaxID=47600 RepID=A0A8J5YK28_9ROSI|nr:hypothetical protein CXB51_025645 [Gossypium anomalum]